MPAPYTRTGVLTNVFRNVRTLLTEPIFKGMIGGILAEPTVKTRPKHVEDESVGDFVERRFGPTIARNMLSALFHGIYAGDIYSLSARTLLPKLWYLETRDSAGAGVIPELFELTFKKETLFSSSDAKLTLHDGYSNSGNEEHARFYHDLAHQSVYTFKHGIAQLTSQLEEALRQDSNVTIATKTPVLEMEREAESGSMNIVKEGEAIGTHDYIISTLDPPQLGSALDLDIPPELGDAATVMVVNLYYPNPNLTDPYRGFGYLIPQSIPMEQNPERALGVIFASETSGPRGSPSQSAPQDSSLPIRWATNHQDTAPGTKLTVMLGGHWWASWAQADIPSPSTAIEMAKSVLARHMAIFDEPLLAKAKLQRNAIPQYRVGHRKNMAAVHEQLQRYQGRLRVAGPAWQGGVGVNDCVRKAWEVVEDLGGARAGVLASDHGEDWQQFRRRQDANATQGQDVYAGGGWMTGLEHYTKDEEWFVVERKGTTMTWTNEKGN